MKNKKNYLSMKDKLKSVFDNDDLFFYSDELLDELTDAVFEELTKEGVKNDTNR